MKLRIAGYTGTGSVVMNILSEKLLEYGVISSEGVGGGELPGLLGGVELVVMWVGRVVVKVRSLASMGRERVPPKQVFLSRGQDGKRGVAGGEGRERAKGGEREEGMGGEREGGEEGRERGREGKEKCKG